MSDCCSFCNRLEKSVRVLVKGYDTDRPVFICNGCVEQAAERVKMATHTSLSEEVDRWGQPNRAERLGFNNEETSVVDPLKWALISSGDRLSLNLPSTISSTQAKEVGHAMLLWAGKQGNRLEMGEVWELVTAGLCTNTITECAAGREHDKVDALEEKVRSLEDHLDRFRNAAKTLQGLHDSRDE